MATEIGRIISGSRDFAIEGSPRPVLKEEAVNMLRRKLYSLKRQVYSEILHGQLLSGFERLFALGPDNSGYVFGEYGGISFTLAGEDLDEAGLKVMEEFGADFKNDQAKVNKEVMEEVLSERDEKADVNAIGSYELCYTADDGITLIKKFTYKKKTGELLEVEWQASKHLLEPHFV